jgi:hypothetical protein
VPGAEIPKLPARPLGLPDEIVIGRGKSSYWAQVRAEGVSFRHAAELLRADLPPEGVTKGRPPERTTVPKLRGLLDASEDDQVLLRRVVDYYHATLKASPEALAYLASRGLQHAEAVERFRLGFANRTLGYRLPAKNRKEGAEICGRLEALWMAKPESVMSSSRRSGSVSWNSLRHPALPRDTCCAAGPVCQTLRNQIQSKPIPPRRSSSASGTSSSVAGRPRDSASAVSDTRVFT